MSYDNFYMENLKEKNKIRWHNKKYIKEQHWKYKKI